MQKWKRWVGTDVVTGGLKSCSIVGGYLGGLSGYGDVFFFFPSIYQKYVIVGRGHWVISLFGLNWENLV